MQIDVFAARWSLLYITEVKRETASSQRFPSLRLSLFHFHADPEESISEEKSIYKELQTAVHLSIIGSRFSTNRTADYMSNKYWGLIRIRSDHIQEIVKYLEALMVFNFFLLTAVTIYAPTN